ncbi:hypothetical protein D3C75_742150 [compost metagenome]
MAHRLKLRMDNCLLVASAVGRTHYALVAVGGDNEDGQIDQLLCKNAQIAVALGEIVQIEQREQVLFVIRVRMPLHVAVGPLLLYPAFRHHLALLNMEEAVLTTVREVLSREQKPCQIFRAEKKNLVIL